MRVLVLAILLAASTAFAQQIHKPKTHQAIAAQQPAKAKEPSTPKLSDSYAKAALIALKAIAGDATIPERREGQLLVNRRTSELIDLADVEATTTEERIVTAKLLTTYMQHLTNNVRRRMIELRYERRAAEQHNSTNDHANQMWASEAMQNDPVVLEMTKREGACFGDFESTLRSRGTMIPPTCANLTPEDDEKK